ncbi:MAG: peptidylprolyl isomerase [Nitrospinaceae bacterium]|mgnify:FL=1|jgi:parvulin-like peptidyl-prolyl isomerase|nr:peptidylprolyl isomerase [Nitrospinota bacterium]MDP6336046.1 peptidylprolyl isomerase [Nitrospinaceae bacterium]MDP7148634.1 peptidylprolyl isomerase [Nitrospinaceae bacterium]|tara:strand:- start:1603 stop:1974 length:372 start_codon:yes stop_codon:yes gene_type:complete
MAIRSIRVSHIVLSTVDVADLLLENLQSCESEELMYKMFKKLAKKYSACGSRNKGGDLGFLEFNTSAPELEKAAMLTPVGKVSGPIKSKFGYHIFVVTEEEKMGDTGVDGITGVSMGAGDGTL